MTTILLVDDDARLLDALAALVEADGYTAVKACDGFQALRCARAQPPALIVTDYMMPAMNGDELVQALRDDPVLSGIPVVMNSAVSIQHASLPITAFLRKPFSPARLLDLLHTHAVPNG